MKCSFLLMLSGLIMTAPRIHAQESIPLPEQQLENQAELTEAAAEDDAAWQQLESFRRHPLDLNRAGREDLESLPMLNALQIDAFLRYRSLLGKLLSVQELQAIPGWSIETIKLVLPFVMVGTGAGPEPWRKRLLGGQHSLLLRATRMLEQAKGYQQPTGSGSASYVGDPQRLFARYKYQYNNLVQYGITADKDAGEVFLNRNAGFDFYSFHFYARHTGKVKALALGDFTVNMGQGLIHWQSLAFKKSSAVIQIKRQGPVLRPYSAAGEYYFHRGAGITVQQGNWEATGFASIRKLDANLAGDSITSIFTSGYHRTHNELNNRNNIDRLTVGGNIKFSHRQWHIGLNTVQYRFSNSFALPKEPYDIYAISGNKWSNYSIDYSLTHSNLHLFGEAAVDRQFNRAVIQGLMVSVDPKVDLSFLYRSIDKRYQSVQGNAFTEAALPNNETGIFMGASFRPAVSWQLDVYADLFRFPWLRYRTNAPGNGTDYLFQVIHKPNKQVELSSRYRYERKPANGVSEGALKPVVNNIRHNWRTQCQFQASAALMLRSRLELVWFQSGAGLAVEKGFSAFTEALYDPPSTFSGSLRLHFFETDSYNARVYAYEQDVPYYFSIPAFSGKGCRYYINGRYNISSLLFGRRSPRAGCTLAFRVAQFLFPEEITSGSGLDEITAKHKTELRVQLLLTSR